jgi:tetratricopeptide (TPR) repeat protein
VGDGFMEGGNMIRGLKTMFTWTILRRSAALSSVGLAIAAGLALQQWYEGPIAIRPFVIEAAAGAAGISASALADQTKAHITSIYSIAGDLFEMRKLGEPTVPLDVKVGSTGWSLQELLGAIGMPLTSAEVAGRITQDGDSLVLQWTTRKHGGVLFDKRPISSAETDIQVKSSLLGEVDRALACLALRTVASLSPDVAANYIHKQDELGAGAQDLKDKCIPQDDAELYSQVSKDDSAPAAARVNALVGLSVHFSYTHQLFEELDMARAASDLAARTLACNEPDVLPTRWQRFQCSVASYRPFSDRNLRAQVTAWMQQGAAYSDYAAAAPTPGEMTQRRLHAIEAFDHVIKIKNDYALAYDAKGVQYSLLNNTSEAKKAFDASLAAGETPPAYIDLGLLTIHGRGDLLDERVLTPVELRTAESQFRRAIELSPDYWDAHGRLGYVLYKSGKLQEATDVLGAALDHDLSNRQLRLLLAAAHAGQCQFDAAKTRFKAAYDANIRDKDYEGALNTVSDWGEALELFGQQSWAIDQETEVLGKTRTHVNALKVLGEIKINSAGGDPTLIEEGLADLKAAVNSDAGKADRVLNAYLSALLTTGRVADAVSTYEAWSRDRWVPPQATNSPAEAAILPAAQRTRLSYARALLKNNQWEAASREFEVLSATGVKLGAQEGDALLAQVANAKAEAAVLTRVGLLVGNAAPFADQANRRSECNLDHTTQLPQLTNQPTPLPQQVRDAVVL